MNFIFSDRSDGLGERLNSVINGLFLSQLTGYDFKFFWRDTPNSAANFQSITPAEEIFSPAFIDRHLISTRLTEASNGSIRLPRGNLDEVRSAINQQIAQGIRRVPQNGFIFNIASPQERESLWAKACAELTFRPEIHELLNEVFSASKRQPKHAVVHVRAGDIIYGQYRDNNPLVSKTIPLPFIVVASRHFLKDGVNIKIVGQEAASVEKLNKINGFLEPVTVERYSKLTPLEASFFDLAQFGAAETIYAGTSGFPRFASQFFLTPLEGLEKKVDFSKISSEVFDEISSFKEIYSSEQKGYAFFYYYLKFPSDDFEFSNYLLSNAVAHQPNNVMYALWFILNDLRFGKYETADRKFSKLIAPWLEKNLKEFSRSRLHPLLTRLDPRTKMPCFSGFACDINDAETAGSYAAKFLAPFCVPNFVLDEHSWQVAVNSQLL